MVRQREYQVISDRVIVIYDAMFPLYIVRGETKNFLIDAGVTARAGDFYTRITRVLEAEECQSKGIDTLLLTHSHWDHAGAATMLQDKFHFDVIASTRTVELLKKEKVIAFIDRLNRDYKKMIDDTSASCFGELKNMSSVKEGDKIPVGPESWFEVFETPGHTKCSTSYLLYPEKILFAGDAAGVLERDGGIKPLFLSSYLDYEASLQKLIALDAHYYGFPHNKFIEGPEQVKSFLKRSLAKARKVKDAIRELLKAGESDEKIAEIIYRREFPKPTLMGPPEALMINLNAMTKAVRIECP
ncbi:MAG: MBL fold metallo-hydrolase [bacterium]|nr:MBL fold metallo-hydrolase [bacterium]